MAEEQIGIDLLLNSGAAATSVRELKQSIRDLQSEALKAGAAGDDALAAKFTAAAGKARDRMADLNKEINAAQDTGSKLGAITGVARSLAGGFAGAAGAAALFGASQKDVQEQLLKVQAAVALLAGVQEMADIKKNFNLAKQQVLNATAIAQTKLKTLAESEGVIVSNLAAAAQWALNAAMNANTVFLIITGVVALTTALIAFTKETKTAEQIQADFNKTMELQLKVMEAVRKEYEEQTKVRFDGVAVRERELELLKAEGASKELIYQKEKEILAEKIKDWEVQKAIILTQRNLTAEEFNYGIDLKNKQLVLDAAFRKDSQDANAEATAKEKKQLEDDLQAFFDAELADQEARKARIAQSELENAEARNAKDEAEKEYELKKYEEDLLLQSQQDQKEIKAAIDKRLKLRAEKDKEIQDEQRLRDAKISIAQSTISSLGNLGKLLNLQGSAAIGLQKTLAVAQIAIDTATAISGLTRISFSPTHADNLVNPLAPYLKLAAGITSILGSMASAKSLLSGSGGAAPTQVPSFDSGGGGGGGSAPLSSPTSQNVGNTSTTLIEQEQQKPVIVKAYVVESEMTNHQQHIRNIEQKATFP